MSKKDDLYTRYLRVFNTMQKFKYDYNLDVYNWDSPAHPYTKEKFDDLYYKIKKMLEVCDIMLDNHSKAREIRDSHPFSQIMHNKLFKLLWDSEPIDNDKVDDYFYHIEDYLDNGGKL